MLKSTINYICHRALPQNLKNTRGIELLNRLMAAEYQKVNEVDYGDCGYPLVHYERDLRLTFDKILHDEEMFRQSRMSKEEYVSAVNGYYFNVVLKDFEEPYCY